LGFTTCGQAEEGQGKGEIFQHLFKGFIWLGAYPETSQRKSKKSNFCAALRKKLYISLRFGTKFYPGLCIKYFATFDIETIGQKKAFFPDFMRQNYETVFD
jgi:hypothetical protein